MSSTLIIIASIDIFRTPFFWIVLCIIALGYIIYLYSRYFQKKIKGIESEKMEYKKEIEEIKEKLRKEIDINFLIFSIEDLHKNATEILKSVENIKKESKSDYRKRLLNESSTPINNLLTRKQAIEFLEINDDFFNKLQRSAQLTPIGSLEYHDYKYDFDQVKKVYLSINQRQEKTKSVNPSISKIDKNQNVENISPVNNILSRKQAIELLNINDDFFNYLQDNKNLTPIGSLESGYKYDLDEVTKVYQLINQKQERRRRKKKIKKKLDNYQNIENNSTNLIKQDVIRSLEITNYQCNKLIDLKLLNPLKSDKSSKETYSINEVKKINERLKNEKIEEIIKKTKINSNS